MALGDALLGRRLATHEEGEQRVGVLAGIPSLGLDALASAAYGPEAALTVLIPLGALGLTYIGPITLLIVGLLLIVYFSYRQTIAAYPTGGGSYTVAKENLGTNAGLLAAAALMLDYILVVAVGISAGVGALVSAFPLLEPYMLPLCLLILLMITIVNLRGTRESGIAFMLPTYAFVICLFAVIAIGLVKTALAGGKPASLAMPTPLSTPTAVASVWLLMHAFSSGCTAMTGVEAVSNGVNAFHRPTVRYARRTLSAIVAILAILLLGIAYLTRAYGIGATEPGHAGYESLLSQLIAAIVGRGPFYYVSIFTVLAVLALSANTGYADFPRLCRVVAHDNFLPHIFGNRGRRLVFSQGIYVLATMAGLLLIIFGGVTDRLIPLFAVGAFLAFTLSQAGMVAHWRRVGGPHARKSAWINGIGATATASTLVVVLVSKFMEGAWITLLLLPIALFIFKRVNRHYQHVEKETACNHALDMSGLAQPVVVVPFKTWDLITHKGLRFALKLSDDVYAIHVIRDEEKGQRFEKDWHRLVEVPAEAAGHAKPHLLLVSSPYRRLFGPLLDSIRKIERDHPDRQIAVIIPDLVEKHWHHYLLHNQTAQVLRTLLFFGGDQRIVIINVPWYLDA